MQDFLAQQDFKGKEAVPHLGEQYKARVAMMPNNYGSACNGFLTSPDKPAEHDFSSILQETMTVYPFRGFVHCALNHLKETRGDKAISALKQRWAGGSNWLQATLQRENENRAKHHSKPVSLNQELTIRAQRWADQLVARCPDQMTTADHISDSHPDATYNGEQTGESIAQHGTHFELEEDDGVDAANSWYSEVKDYPWPEYKGNGRDSQFEAIGHFTAQVWKGTREAGYGLGKRKGCDKVYVVARYYPAGNLPGTFGKNVLAP